LEGAPGPAGAEPHDDLHVHELHRHDGTETGLLASIADPLGHTVSYTYSLPGGSATGTVWVTGISEPSSGGTVNWVINPVVTGSVIYNYFGIGSASSVLICDASLRATNLLQSTSTGQLYSWAYDSANNVITRTD